MTVSVFSAAKRLCTQSDWTLSNLEIQKRLYIANMYHIGFCDKTPLVFGCFEAWDFGPVHPKLYQKLKVFGADPVEDYLHGYKSVLDDTKESYVIDYVAETLASTSAGKLVGITHWKGGAWYKRYKPGIPGIVITNEDIWEEFNNLEQRRQQRGQQGRLS